MPTYKNELECFIYEKCYDRIYNPLAEWVAEHPTSLELLYSRIEYPDTATLCDMLLEFTTNVSIVEDVISFDAVVSCEIELEEETYHDRQSSSVSQWFKVSCSVTVEDKIKGFVVREIESYSRSRQPKREGATDSNLVPIIYPKDLDAEATRFLESYYPEALTMPMPVPIEEIVRGDRLNLNLIKGGRLTDDFRIFGQICFSEGKVKVYNILDDGEAEIDVGRGTIIIDAMTYWERNLGCVNNTIAHEAFHWHRHRVYAAVKSILRGEKFIATRCLTKSTKPYRSEEDKTPWTDEERMEWQANHVAPRILMPIQTVRIKIEELYAKYGYYENETDRTMILECVIDELSEFYKVSKQSAKIRMIDLGYKEADTVYNYDGFVPYFTGINPRDAFYEYCDNEDFFNILNTGLFRYVDGTYVIDNEKYITQDNDEEYSLTDYARKNLQECALHFTYRRVDMRVHGQFHHDAFHRANPDSYQKLPRYDSDKNASVVANALAFKAGFQEEYGEISETTKTFSQRVVELMERKGWDAHKFAKNTCLEPNNYYRITRGETENPSIETILNISIGLGLPTRTRDELISLAGRSWQNSQLHCAYRYILENGNIQSVADFNAAFALLEIDASGKSPLKDDT